MKRFALPAVAVATLFSAAYAAAPKESEYRGRPLPQPVREMVWEKACDLPQAEDSCGNAPCTLKRSNGQLFRPQVAPWQDLMMFEWPAASNMFGPALSASKTITSIDDIQGSSRVALELVSGLPLQDPRVAADSGPLTVNPKMVGWFQENLMPDASQPMCGSTAGDLYAQAFRGPTRIAAEVYAELQKKGLLKQVKVAALSKSFDSQRGTYAAACAAIGKKAKVPDEEWPRVGNCWWWLRRAATGTAEPMAALLGEALRRYDGETWKRLERSFPKAPAATP